ncbi:MAG: hypothetical protein ABII90_09045 [Bacteroidota bacterium]
MRFLHIYITLIFFLSCNLNDLFAQSNNCNTATVVTLFGGSGCVNGTTVGATSAMTMYSTCNPNPVNEVWYTYVATGSQNDYTVTSNGLTDAEIIIYSGGCAVTLENCDVETGTNTLNSSWGFVQGTQVWVGIASNGGTEGGFELCIDSYNPAPGGGNACAGAIPLCDKSSFSVNDMTPFAWSGQLGACFGNGNQDIYGIFLP